MLIFDNKNILTCYIYLQKQFACRILLSHFVKISYYIMRRYSISQRFFITFRAGITFRNNFYYTMRRYYISQRFCLRYGLVLHFATFITLCVLTVVLKRQSFNTRDWRPILINTIFFSEHINSSEHIHFYLELHL